MAWPKPTNFGAKESLREDEDSDYFFPLSSLPARILLPGVFE